MSDKIKGEERNEAAAVRGKISSKDATILGF